MQMISPLPSEDAGCIQQLFHKRAWGFNSSKWIEAFYIGVAKTRLNAFQISGRTESEVSSVLEIGPGQGYFMRESKTDA